jgi:hypothetical protein
MRFPASLDDADRPFTSVAMVPMVNVSPRPELPASPESEPELELPPHAARAMLPAASAAASALILGMSLACS